MPSGPSNHHRIAIVGASSLRGKELQQVLEDRHFPANDFVLLDESVAAGTLTAAAGEPTFIRALDQESFQGARFAFFAGTAHDALQNWSVAQRSGATVIDLTTSAGPDRKRRVIAWGVFVSSCSSNHRVYGRRRVGTVCTSANLPAAFSPCLRSPGSRRGRTRKANGWNPFLP
jgi:hypothetical protein